MKNIESKKSEEPSELTLKGYHKLVVWQKAKELVLLIYQYTKILPASEEFCLESQLRKAAVSVVVNIVQGYRMHTRKEYLHFLYNAEVSLAEVEASTELLVALECIPLPYCEELELKSKEVTFLLHHLISGLD